MLVLTRRIKESVKIANEIEITILQIRGNQVRLGVTAPEHIAIHREEVYRKLQTKNSNQSVQNISQAKIRYFNTYRTRKRRAARNKPRYMER